MSTEVSCLGFDVTDGFEKNPMNIASFDDLLVAARQQPEPQRLLFVFAGVDLPYDATEAQRAAEEAERRHSEKLNQLAAKFSRGS